jgi:hypothetical protein
MGEIREAYRILPQKSEGKRTSRPGHRWKYIKIDLKMQGMRIWTGVFTVRIWSRDGLL